ncbi:retrovirus-related pol polyprotein from transposon TNT 1-94 [Tanacetum coccineum]|uniref:Retrovirus-related pol polyprotein from transposon TNT 1-94 n=1 Tax=Tanacetum coccineum TaxID=301880 RepID=A0ABQ5CKB6_9ASTR
MTESPLIDSGFAVLVFSPGDYPIACLNKAMAFLTAVASSRFPATNNQLRTSSNPRNQATIQDGRVTVQQVQGRQGQSYSSTRYKSNATSSRGNNISGHARVVKCYNCQGEGHMARQCTQPKQPRNAAWYKKKAMLAEAQEAGQLLDEEQLAFLADPRVPDGQSVQKIILNNAAFQTEDFKTYDSNCDDISNAQAVLMANISNYGSDVISKADVQDTHLQAQQDSMILSVIEQMSEQMINHVNNWEKANKEQNNESVTAELERYKERVKTFEQRLNIYLISREKMIDSQMDDMIREKLALKEQVFSLEQNISKQIKEKECFLQTFTVFKSESKEKEDYMENEIDLEKKIKELDNILFKVGQSTQTVHMLTKPQAFYDNKHKTSTSIVMSDKHVAMPVIDDEETLILEEESRSKMSGKAKDPENCRLNKLSVCYVRSLTSKPFDAFTCSKSKPPKELPKISLVNESLKKLKFHFAKFDNVVKIRTTPNAHIFNMFDRDLLNEIMEVKTVFDQMDAVCTNSLSHIPCLEIAKKELLLENDRLLQQIMSQDVLLSVMNSMSLIGETVNMDGNRKESCNLEAELLKSQNAVFKEQSYSIKKSRVRSKEQSDSLIDKLNLKSAWNKDLKAQIQDKVFVITSLKNDLRKIKGKEIVDIAAQIPSANTIVPGMFKLDLEPLAPRLLQNREAHIDYLKYTQEQADILWEIVAQAKAEHPLDKELDFALLKRLLSYLKTRTRKLGLKCSTSKCGSKPTGNKKNDRISRPSSRNMKNKVEAQPRKVNKKNRVKSLFDDVHDKCFLDFVKNVNSRAKSVKKHKKQNIWKPTGHVFTEVGFKWKATGKTFTIVGNLCPLTRITSANVVPPKTTTSHSVESQKPELKVYNRKPKSAKNVGSRKKAQIVESKNANHSEPNHTWRSNATDFPSSSSFVMTGCPDCSLYLDSGCSKHMTGNCSQLMNFVSKFLGTVRFENEHIARIMGYGDYQLGNDLEVAFRKNTCFIRNLEGVDLLSGSHDTNLYIISLDDMLKTCPVCLLSKATKSWLWHRRLSHLNFGTINKLAKDGLARGIPRLKFQKDHLCSVCALGKSKKSSHQPKAEDTNQEKLYLLHMDLFLRTKDEAPEAIIKCIKNIQVRLNATVRNVRTDNGTEFVNQTLREFYENVGISHQTSVARTPQQNGVVERQNRTLVEASHTMLIFSKAPLFLWAKAINTSCYTQNRSIIRCRYNKTPYELLQEKKPDVSFFHVFGALCYSTNDNDDLGKLDAKANIGLISNPVSQQPCIPSNIDDLDHLFQPMFDEYFTPPPIAVTPVQEVAAPRAVVLADSPVSTFIDQDAPSSSTQSTQEQEQSPNISQGFEESPKTPIFRDDPLNESPHEESSSQGSSLNVKQTHTPFEHLGKWTKNHPIAKRDQRSFSLCLYETDAMWCYFDAFLTSIEPKNFKQAMTEPSWIDAMQEEIHEFQRLEV